MTDPEGIVVLGAPRSGTTLLRRLIAAHPDIACPSETYVFGACARFLRAQSFGDDLSTGVESGLAFSGISPNETVERLREFAFGLLRDISRKEGKSRWAEKTAFDAFQIDGIERLCTEHCRYVLLYRHGCDVACSIGELVDKMEVTPEELRPYVARHPRPLVAYANAWADVAGRMRKLERERPELSFAMRYEDLVADPKRELARLFEFLSAPTDVDALLSRAFDPGLTGLGDWKTYQLHAIQPDSVGRWTGVSEASRRALAEVCNPLLEELNYERVECPDAKSPSQGRHRLQLELAVAGLSEDANDSGNGER